MKLSPDSTMKYQDFIKRYPRLGQAWDAIHEEEAQGPLDARTARLVKLAVAVGARQEGAVHAAVRKALKAGLTREELEHVVALGVATVGMPGSVAAYTWVQAVLEEK